MTGYRLTEAAQADIVDILVWSQTRFGAIARRRYERLIITALMDIAADPVRAGSIARPELGADVRSWHLRGSRDRARSSDGTVQRPRHFVIYRQVDVGCIAIGRILHEAMELDRHTNLGGAWADDVDW
jgi:toxin ParE1/3/4